MTFDEAEELWREQLDAYDDSDGIDAVFKEMVEVALGAFKDRKMYINVCKRLKEELAKMKESTLAENHTDLITMLINSVNEYDANNVTTSFNVDNCRVTIIAERKGE